MSFLNNFLGLFKNTINYAIKGIILVLISYTFRFLTRWATGDIKQMLLQFLIMSTGLYVLDSLLHILLPPEISASPKKECPKIKCPEVKFPECPPCNCVCQCPEKTNNTPPVETNTPSPSGIDTVEGFASF